MIVRNITEKEKKEKAAIKRSEQEKMIRIPLEIFGNLGLVPLYKEIRKNVNDYIYKDLGKGKEKFPSNFDDMNKSDMKRYFPEEYERRYGKGTPEYYKNIPESEERKKEREEKDLFYNYKSSKNKSNRQSSREKTERSSNRSSSRN